MVRCGFLPHFAQDPFDILALLNNSKNLEMDGYTLFSNQKRSNAFSPALNVSESDAGLKIVASCPGIKPEEIEISLVGRELTIKGDRSFKVSEEARYLLQERVSGEFKRIIKLPFDPDSEKIEAVHRNGLLTLNVPRATSGKTTKIVVKS